MLDELKLQGFYTAICHDKDGNFKWEAYTPNTVVTIGKNLNLDIFLSGSSYTVTGPLMGLISSVDYSAISASDTMSSHSGWREAGDTNAPTYSGTRGTCTWNDAASGSKTLATPVSFSITSTGTLEGCFIVLGPGAVSTIDDTNGTLFSAGLFASGSKDVNNGDTINVSYTISV